VGNSPNETHWRDALYKIKPQYRTPKMQGLLQKYYVLLAEGGGQQASNIEQGFLESLITTM
jgi:hypothetical protein